MIYAFVVGFPMLFLYVIGLPLWGFVAVRRMQQAVKRERRAAADVPSAIVGSVALFSLSDLNEDHRVYGLFYSAFRENTWWWELFVSGRKIVIAFIGVFGADMEDMQVHITLMLVMGVMLITAQVRPFGGARRGLLQMLEMASLMAIFLTLWAGSVFNTRPRCESPSGKEGETIPWCDALSVMVGLNNFGVMITIVACFGWLKYKARQEKKKGGGGGGGKVEMKDWASLNPLFQEGEESGSGSSSAVSLNLSVLRQRNRQKQKQQLQQQLQQHQKGKKKTNQRAKMDWEGTVETVGTMVSATEKAETVGHEDQQKKEDALAICSDDNGRRYSYNPTTRESTWLDEMEVEICADDSGRKYSYNPTTGESTWLDEVEEVEMEIFEDESGRQYAWNPVMEEAKWLDEL